MKPLFLSFFLSLPFLFTAQSLDTAFVKHQVDSLIELSWKLTQQRNFEKALIINDKAEKLALEKLGRISIAYSRATYNHGIALHYKGEYKKAEKYYLEARTIRERILGKEHPDYISTSRNLGTLYRMMGHYEKAESIFLETLSSKSLYKDSSEYMITLNSLAILYGIMAKYEKAAPLLLETATFWKKASGEKKLENYGMVLANLANLYRLMGLYEKAEPLHWETLNVLEQAFGTDHPYYAGTLNNLALLYDEIGNYEKNEQLTKEGLNITKKTLGKEHPDYAQYVNNLANIYLNKKNYEKAEEFYLEAKTIREKVLGKKHPDYMQSVHNLATLYGRMNLYEKAESLYLENLDTRKNTIGKEHPDYANSLISLAILYNNMGNIDQSEKFYLEAITIQKKTLGKAHSLYAKSLMNLAKLYWMAGQHNKVRVLIEEANNIEKSLLAKSTRYLSEQELSAFTASLDAYLDISFSFVQLETEFSINSFDNLLFYKGFLLHATRQASQFAQTDSASTEIYYNLKSYHRRLAKEYAKPITQRQNVPQLEATINTLEKELARTVAGFGETLRQINWREIQAKLKPGEAAVEFVHYKFHKPDPTDSTFYAALILRPGDRRPHFVPLFEEKELQALLDQEYKSKKEHLTALYSPPRKKNTSLYQLIWRPVEKLLKKSHTLYTSPSGLLHQINLGAIMTRKNQTWNDKRKLIILGSTRRLAVENKEEKERPLAAQIYGGVEYEMDSLALSRAIAGFTNSKPRQDELAFSMTERSERGQSWNPLPGAEREAEKVNALVVQTGGSASLLTGYEATEESFIQLGQNKPSPRILHLATHGYFYANPTEEDRQAYDFDQKSAFKTSDHPMIRSGLILAGGNYKWKTDRSLPDTEDGILTAYEVSQVNLRNTELVVLSACDTGLGDIEGNEGVYGLQRAFKIAGAKNLVMSLWKVPDEQTQEMMTTFYRFWLEEKKSIPDAFRAAQQAMRAKYKEHYYWAGFVLVE